METIDIGFVGCGFMGQLAHLANFAMDPRCRIVAIADYRPKLARMVADRYGIPRTYRTHTDLLEGEDIDAIVEITQDDQHAPVAIDAIELGKHVYTEKPISSNLEDARRMVRAAKRQGVKLQVSYMKRYDPGVELAKEHVAKAMEDGSLGQITYARSHGFGGNWICNIGKPITTDEPVPPVKPANPAWLPGNMIQSYRTYLNVYCHNINLVRHLVGNPGDASFSSYHEGAKLLLMDYPTFPAAIETGWLSASFWDERTEVYFRDGRITIDTPPPLLRNVPARIEIYRAGSTQTHLQPVCPSDWSFRRSAEHFVDCIINDQTPRSSGEDSILDVELVESAFRKLIK
jgi:predicted dehydrogenase